MFTSWNGVKSHEFTAANGVRQGGVLSPLLFNIYFDEMLTRLKDNGVGCRIRLYFIGALAYADDVVLLCPSRKGLQEMLNICEGFGNEYSASFNARKTYCIKFSRKYTDDQYVVKLNGNVLTWDTSVNHLGNTIDQLLKDSEDIKKKKGVFIGSLNKLLANFGKLQSYVLVKLFQNYCCSFYGSVLWKREDGLFKDICTEWNKALRRVWHLPYTAHTCMLGPLNGKCHISDQLNVRFVKFYNRMVKCDNKIVNFIANLAKVNYNGFLRNNIMYIKWKYNVDVMNTLMCKCIHVMKKCSQPPPQYVSHINLLKELILVRDSVNSIAGFNFNEIVEMITDVSTSFI